MMLDTSGNVWTKNTNNLGTSGWNEVWKNGGIVQVAADGTDGIQMILDNAGNAYAMSSTDINSADWTKETTGVSYIAAGGGLQFIITSGYLYSKVTSSISNSGWNIEINGGTSAVAADHDNNLQMALVAGNVYAKSTSSQGTSGWNEEQVGGQMSIATGG